MLWTCNIFHLWLYSPFLAQESNNSICLHHRGDRATKSSCGIRVMDATKRRQWEFERWLFNGHIRKYTIKGNLVLCALQENREWVTDCSHKQTGELKAGCGKLVFSHFYNIGMVYRTGVLYKCVYINSIYLCLFRKIKEIKTYVCTKKHVPGGVCLLNYEIWSSHPVSSHYRVLSHGGDCLCAPWREHKQRQTHPGIPSSCYLLQADWSTRWWQVTVKDL